MASQSVFKALLLATLVPIATLGLAFASNLTIGKHMSAAELARYADSPVVQIETQSFKVLSVDAKTKSSGGTSGAVTQVVNERGVVGESRNEVVVSQAAVDTVQQVTGKLRTSPVSTQYYGHMNLSMLRFASFQEAVNARAQLKTLLPQARADLPIRYTKPVAR